MVERRRCFIDDLFPIGSEHVLPCPETGRQVQATVVMHAVSPDRNVATGVMFWADDGFQFKQTWVDLNLLIATGQIARVPQAVPA